MSSWVSKAIPDVERKRRASLRQRQAAVRECCPDCRMSNEDVQAEQPRMRYAYYVGQGTVPPEYQEAA